jgi:hypothetical protein
MDASAKPEQSQEPSLEEEVPVRDRYADLVEEARIGSAGGGAIRLSPVLQAFVYLIVMSLILLAIYWASRPG